MTIHFSHDFRQLIESLVGKDSKQFASLLEIRPFPAFRFNPLKHTILFQKSLLKNQGIRFHELEGLAPAARVDEKEPRIGRSFSHFVGHLYIQDLASMLPVLVLDPEPDEWVLDMCAAPGSKTTQLAATMGNRGLIVANDVSVRRLRSLVFNLRRMGVKNTVVCKGFGEQYGNLHFETFHRVLVDPPCSALGTLQKSPEVLTWWTPAKSEKLAGIQFRLVESGLKTLRPGGILTYSTCTITPEENEQVLDQVLRKFPVELEQIHLPGLKTRPGLTRYRNQQYRAELSRAIRVYPWDNQSEAFFVARIRKTGSFGKRNEGPTSSYMERFLSDSDQDGSIGRSLNSLVDHYGIPPSTFSGDCYSLQHDLCCSSSEVKGFPLSPLFVKAGLPVAHIRAGRVALTTEGAHLFGHLASRRIVHLPNLDSMESYVNRGTLPSLLGDSYQVLVCYENAAIGHAVSDKGNLLSRFPRTGWKFEFPMR